MKRIIILLSVLLCLAMFITACDNGSPADSQELTALPPPEPDGGPFGVDLNINVPTGTVDEFLG